MQLEIKHLITTGTPTQQPQTLQLYCFSKLVVLAFTSATQSSSAEPMKSKFSFTFPFPGCFLMAEAH